jgi:hypothetical protein
VLQYCNKGKQDFTMNTYYVRRTFLEAIEETMQYGMLLADEINDASTSF